MAVAGALFDDATEAGTAAHVVRSHGDDGVVRQQQQHCGSGASRLHCLTPPSSSGMSGWIGVQLSSFHDAVSSAAAATALVAAWLVDENQLECVTPARIG